MIDIRPIKRVSIYRLFFLIIPLFLFSGCIVVSRTPLKREQTGGAPSGELIRVEVSKGASMLRVKGASRGVANIESAPGGLLSVNSTLHESITLSPGGGGRDSFIYIDGRPYRGTIEVIGTAKGLQVINELYLEDYLVGLINNEISSSWPLEVVKAQAVIARTYALFQKEKRSGELFHLSATVIDQVYKGSATEDNAALRAVRDTSGEVLTYKGEIALALYHSNAGGKTESAANVWGKDYTYLRSVKSPYDSKAHNFEWSYAIGAEALERSLRAANLDIEKIKGIRIRKRSRSKRVISLEIIGRGGSVKLTGERLRAILGYGNIKSTLFRVRKRRSNFVFTGKGSGHGVGLSQWGAKGMAGAGRKYKGILSYYYPGTRLQKVY